MNNLHLRDGKVEFRWKRWRNKKRQEVSYCLMVLFSGAVLFGGGGMALAGPTGGQVTSGTGTISQAGTTTTISQTSNVLDINWQTFSTAPNETVNFNQPGSSALAINRVVGGVPSYLQGALNANGRVFILNSAGITFAGTSRVNVGALLATTAMTIDGNANQFANFSAPSGSGGSVINQGQITVSNGGFAILAAPYVQNTGFIKADLGTVALAGTNQFTLDLRGDGLINFVVPPGTAAQIVADGQKVGVDNSGTLQARSGQVIISANVATQVVNAVVNLKGVVDADAFAANGAGGTVMVTSTGDINLGGTVTAQGNGTGAGGKIELSGQQMRLGGEIDPGKGGSILIDPKNIVVLPGAGFSHNVSAGSNAGGTTDVNETWVASHLQAGQNVTLAATHDVAFRGSNSAADFILAGGGGGNLTVTAGRDILFSHVRNYEIQTGGGQVALTATAGTIGSALHRLSVVSGVGVTQAGDVVLNAGQDIFLDNVTITSVAAGGGARKAILQAHAGHNIAVAGAIALEASASGIGALASAEAELFANGAITVNGQVTVLANAHGAGGSVEANAGLIAAASHSVIGNSIRTGAASSIHFAHGVDVEAKAVGDNNGAPVKANAKAHGLLAANLVTVAGPATVKATASGSDLHPAANALSTGDITACAILTAEDGTLDFAQGYYHRHVAAQNVTFGSLIDVEAKALGGSNLIDLRGAFASAELYGNDIAVHGEATVKASAGNSGAKLDLAAAHLIVAGSANSQSFGRYLHDFPASSIAFKQGIAVSADAHGGAIGSAANAVALAALAGHDITIGGSAEVKADANGHGPVGSLAGPVYADARFDVGNDIVRHDSANAFYSYYAIPQGFAGDVVVDKALDVEASASGSHLANAGVIAHAHVDIRGARAMSSSVVLYGPVTVRTQASGNDIRMASADAVFVVAIDSGKLYMPEHVLVDAGALGNDDSVVYAAALGHVFSSAKNGNGVLISSDGITLSANAVGNGGSHFDGRQDFATASLSVMVAHITALPGDDQGSVFVQAGANAADMRNILASDGAFFYSYNEVGAIKLNVPLIVHAHAHGTGQGSQSGEILAYANMAANGKSVIFAPGRPNTPAIDIEATGSGRSAKDIMANAYALFGESDGQDALAVYGLVVHAKALGDSANGTVHAVASGHAQGNGAQIRTPTIGASASGSAVGNDVYASANLITREGSHGITIGPGGADLEARANGIHVAHSVQAHAEADYSDAGLTAVYGPTKILALANGSFAGEVRANADLIAGNSAAIALDDYFKGAIVLEAAANVGAGGAGLADAVAEADLAAANYIRIFGSGSPAVAITATAIADPQNHAHVASADASANANAGGSLYINGNVTDQADAMGSGSFNASHHDHAIARQHLEGGSVTIAGNLRSLAFADGSWSKASATVEIAADGIPGNIHLTQQQDPIARASAGLGLAAFRQAHFSSSGLAAGTHNSSALADIDITHNGNLAVTLKP